MQLIIYHKVDTPLVLPLGYHHIIQSILFRGLESNPEYSAFLHDRGYHGKKEAGEVRHYKLFTFGLLKGKYSIREGKICFTEDVTFEVRSVEPKFLELLKRSFEQHGINYMGQHYSGVQAVLRDEKVKADKLLVRMDSPICVYSTDVASGKTFYYGPEDGEFGKRLNESFQRKYTAYTGEKPASDISVELWKLHPKDKYVTKYKGFYITAWKGKYLLRGELEYLDFLYQTGLGSKNSQGFGMFEVLE